MVVMEEAACFGSQAEVPGTGGREKRALGREMTRQCNSNTQSGENGSGRGAPRS